MGNAEGTSIATRRLALVVALTLALTPLALAEIPPPDTPTAIWPTLATWLPALVS